MGTLQEKQQIGKYYEDSICECKLIKRKKLYGFDGGKRHKFILLKFENERAFNKVKNLWYTTPKKRQGGKENGFTRRKLNPSGYIYDYSPTYLYEANIPPLLRYFHMKEVSPSGWIAVPNAKMKKPKVCKTSCKYEFIVSYKDIIPLNNKETPVPLKICSFDIEASSSHGDFPLPVKNYKKLRFFGTHSTENRCPFQTFATDCQLNHLPQQCAQPQQRRPRPQPQPQPQPQA